MQRSVSVLMNILIALCTFLALVFLFLLARAHAQTAPIKNPSAVAFTCPDHALDTAHELDIVRESDGAVIQTLQGGDPPLNSDNEVVIALNVQPITFGTYRIVVRAIAGTVKSDNSDPSPAWERAPGKPSRVAVR